MAQLKIDSGELVLHLTALEKAEGLHGNLRVPLSAVRRVEVLDDAHGPVDRGQKVGTRIPGVVEVGLVHRGGRKIFAAVHRATPRGIRVVLEGSSRHEWIVGCVDPEAIVARLGFSLS